MDDPILQSYTIRTCHVSKTAAKLEGIEKGEKRNEEVSNGCSGEF
ncbi:hypothetical protein B4065_3188 [Caldibacillus thermoamylovorans]|nr:hypothetical protein B4065_3188 [Caldibacillus thermoamylovorans]